MNSNLKNQQKKNFLELEDETKESKTFVQQSFKIDYMNTSKIFEFNSPNSTDVKVNNYLCYQQGQNLYKITEIIYEGKLIRIEDKFEVSMNGCNLAQWSPVVDDKIKKQDKKCSRNIQKVRMFNKKTKKDSKAQKKDKKNIVKNVVKIFLSWLQKKQENNPQLDQASALNQIKKLLHTENYNNRLIKKMIQNKQISKAFLNFLEDNAEQQIKYSRIQDKESHYQALQIYKSLLLKTNNSLGNSNENSFSSNSDADESGASASEESREKNSQNKSQLLNNKVCIKDNIQVVKDQFMDSGDKFKQEKSRTQESTNKSRIILINNGSNSISS